MKSSRNNFSEGRIENEFEVNSVKTFNEKENAYYDIIKNYLDNLKSSNEKPLEYKLKYIKYLLSF